VSPEFVLRELLDSLLLDSLTLKRIIQVKTLTPRTRDQLHKTVNVLLCHLIAVVVFELARLARQVSQATQGR
jgi:hypothetical protein